MAYSNFKRLANERGGASKEPTFPCSQCQEQHLKHELAYMEDCSHMLCPSCVREAENWTEVGQLTCQVCLSKTGVVRDDFVSKLDTSSEDETSLPSPQSPFVKPGQGVWSMFQNPAGLSRVSAPPGFEPIETVSQAHQKVPSGHNTGFRYPPFLGQPLISVQPHMMIPVSNQNGTMWPDAKKANEQDSTAEIKLPDKDSKWKIREDRCDYESDEGDNEYKANVRATERRPVAHKQHRAEDEETADSEDEARQAHERQHVPNFNVSELQAEEDNKPRSDGRRKLKLENEKTNEASLEHQDASKLREECNRNLHNVSSNLALQAGFIANQQALLRTQVDNYVCAMIGNLQRWSGVMKNEINVAYAPSLGAVQYNQNVIQMMKTEIAASKREDALQQQLQTSRAINKAENEVGRILPIFEIAAKPIQQKFGGLILGNNVRSSVLASQAKMQSTGEQKPSATVSEASTRAPVLGPAGYLPPGNHTASLATVSATAPGPLPAALPVSAQESVPVRAQPPAQILAPAQAPAPAKAPLPAPGSAPAPVPVPARVLPAVRVPMFAPIPAGTMLAQPSGLSTIFAPGPVHPPAMTKPGPEPARVPASFASTPVSTLAQSLVNAQPIISRLAQLSQQQSALSWASLLSGQPKVQHTMPSVAPTSRSADRSVGGNAFTRSNNQSSNPICDAYFSAVHSEQDGYEDDDAETSPSPTFLSSEQSQRMVQNQTKVVINGNHANVSSQNSQPILYASAQKSKREATKSLQDASLNMVSKPQDALHKMASQNGGARKEEKTYKIGLLKLSSWSDDDEISEASLDS